MKSDNTIFENDVFNLKKSNFFENLENVNFSETTTKTSQKNKNFKDNFSSKNSLTSGSSFSEIFQTTKSSKSNKFDCISNKLLMCELLEEIDELDLLAADTVGDCNMDVNKKF